MTNLLAEILCFASSDKTIKAGRRWKDSQLPGRGAENILTSPTPLLHPLTGTFGEEGNPIGTPPPARAGLPNPFPHMMVTGRHLIPGISAARPCVLQLTKGESLRRNE